MSSILSYFEFYFFYALYFLLCMVAVVTVLQGWPVGGQMLFAFGLPIVLVWWQGKRRSRKVEAKVLSAESTNTRVTQSESVARVSAHEKRIERVRERTREANAIQSSSTAPPKPPKQDYAEIVRAGQTAAPALSAIAKRYENARPSSRKLQTNSQKNGWVPSAETATNAEHSLTRLFLSQGQGKIGQGRECHTGLGILIFQHEAGRPILNGWQDISKKTRCEVWAKVQTYLAPARSGQNHATGRPIHPCHRSTFQRRRRYNRPHKASNAALMKILPFLTPFVRTGPD